MVDLKSELENLARSLGVRLFGVAPIERFEGAPSGHHPLDFLPQARNVIVIGIPIPWGSINYQNLLQNSSVITGEFRQEYLQRYFYQVTGYDVLNQRLEQIALSLTLFLEDKGVFAIYFPPTYGPYKDIQDRVPGQMGIFSMRHAAVRAGLGEFGLNNVILTPQYGPRVRFTSIITSAELEPTPLLAEKLCRGTSCQACLKGCGPGALQAREELTVVCPPQLKWEETLTYKTAMARGQDLGDIEKIVWYDPVSRTNMEICRSQRLRHFCYGKCLRVCPVGARNLN